MLSEICVTTIAVFSPSRFYFLSKFQHRRVALQRKRICVFSRCYIYQIFRRCGERCRSTNAGPFLTMYVQYSSAATQCCQSIGICSSTIKGADVNRSFSCNPGRRCQESAVPSFNQGFRIKCGREIRTAPQFEMNLSNGGIHL